MSHSPTRVPFGPANRRLQCLATAVGLILAGILLWGFSARSGPGPSPGTVANESDVAVIRGASAPRGQSVFAVLRDDECWSQLPRRIRGREGRLPLWARSLARTLPQTTAAMLELDYLHRAGQALDPKLRGEIRWAAAHANRCAYGEVTALLDLRAAGVSEDELGALTGEPSHWPSEPRMALEFATRLTVTPQAVTDREVAQLIEHYGEKQIVAIVLLLAYANFQDRLVLALNLDSEPDGPVPPLDVKFARRRLGEVAHVPPRTEPSRDAAREVQESASAPDFPALDLAHIQDKLVKQRCRQPRIHVPNANHGVNRWGLVGQTYQPELATAWSACTQAFGEEADQDPVFEQSLFWVVTRTKQCFY